MNTVEYTTNFLAFMTIVAQAMTLLIVLSIILRNKYPQAKRVLHFFGSRGIVFSFIVALMAMTGSLFYSDIAHYEPCVLCWYQRIFMYPLVLLFYIAFIRKESVIYAYTTPMAIIGGALALYHYLLQIGVTTIAPCKAVGYSVSCTEYFSMTFGYVTIPMMAFGAFGLILALRFADKYRS